MQISASTLLASQQQALRVAPRQAQPADASGFAPINFKQAAKPQAPVPQTQAAAQPVSGPSTGYVRPGTHIDIKI